MSQMMTVEDLKKALPKNLYSNATQEFADKINQIAVDPEAAEVIRDNFITYSRVLQDGAYKTGDYLNAVMYCTFKLMGHTNKDAYAKAFPDRYTALVARGATDKDISAYVSMYHKNKLVNAILEQAFIPTWLLNQDTYQKAINTQADLMMNAQSELVRTTAANSLLQHLKQPEVKKVELDLKLKNGGGLDDLRTTMAELVEAQLKSGMPARSLARMPLAQREQEVIDVVPVPVARIAPAIPNTLSLDSTQALRTAMTGSVGANLEHEHQVQRGKHSAFVNPDPEPEDITPMVRPSLFGIDRAKPGADKSVIFELKSPAVNYAKCCEGLIEDCSCAPYDHIYLPIKEDVPLLKRVSLFDDPAGMP